MRRLHVFPGALVAWLLLLLSCGGASPQTERQRAVRREAPVQWNHDWARGAVFYEIFVRSFADSDGDGVGDFDGLVEKLDYLNDGDPATTSDLGIEGIWLMPIFEATSYHGYDTVNYEAIEKDYGTSADFRHFLDQAHERGIRVIVDLVLNHTGSEHPWFVDSASSPAASRRDWYVWSPVDPGWSQPWGGEYGSWHPRNGAYYYGAFWGGMPDVNYRNPRAKAEMFRLTRHWLEEGVDGYRLDATRYLVETGPGEAGQADTEETHRVLEELAAEVRRARPEAILVAENTVDTPTLATYFGSTAVIRGGDQIPMNFNFPLASALVEGVNASNATRIRATLHEMIRTYPSGVIDAPFLTNHDQTRLATVLGSDPGKLRNAAAVLLTLPGAPFLYYGEEVGLRNGPGPMDESKRTPMPWSPSGGFTEGTPWRGYAPGLPSDNVASQDGDPGSLLSYYRDWIAARKGSAALRKGDIVPLETGPRILAFLRDSGGEQVLVVHNLADSFADTGPLAVGAEGFETVRADPGVAAPQGRRGSWRVALPPRSSGAWRGVRVPEPGS
ncbi:MAG TPA: alpha-amylase family glycosyl hydrolase [Thermoanaerobaculia bacterium]|nr:alpha-amylase family glycosyl hydrolase [Thermoanaerobaculia bacterium]